MRKIVLSFFISILSFESFGAEVKKADAEKVALNWFRAIQTNDTFPGNDSKVLESYELIDEGKTILHLFNMMPDGFVLVSGDNTLEPIVGYSPEGHFDSRLHSNALLFVKSFFASQIRNALQNRRAPALAENSSWNALLNEPKTKLQKLNMPDEVVPLIKSKWNQSAPFNASCPRNSLAGCGAAAMSQMLKYWRYPAHGYAQKNI